VLDLLWDRLSPQLQLEPEPALPRAADTETDQLLSQAHVEDLSITDLMDGIFATLAPLAASREMSLENQLPANLPLVRANRVVLRQGILGLISAALQRFSRGQIRTTLAAAADFRLWVQADGKPQPGASTKAGLDVSRKLIAGLGGQVEIHAGEESWQAEISLPKAEELPILVMDDNAGLIELYRRYVAGRGYRVVDAHSADEMITLAQKHNPRLIILDVMMPDQDGWEVLQRLKAAAPTQSIPVMICSVLDETEIAFALGASDYLSKPVTQDALLAKVERWCRKAL
jgi:CheY-like chemotaxis protein